MVNLAMPLRPRTPVEGPRPPEPIIAPTGNTTVDALANVVNRAAQPFQEAPPPEQGTLGVISNGVNAALGVVGAPFEMLDTGMAMIAAPLAALVPGMPAATLGAPHLGTPHAHAHPPSLIPPAPPVPLPSIGTVLGAGCVSVLVGGIPAARASDVGLAPTCGGFAPAFEIWTGSSNTFIGGSRAARMTMDLTRHCNPASAVGAFGKVMGAVCIAAGALGAGAAAAAGQALAAAMMAAQAAADAAALAMSMLLGKDPGIPPSMGVLMVGNPTVLVGGFPMPDTLEVIMGAAGMLRSLKKLKKIGKKKFKGQNVDCDRPGHPVDPVTGTTGNEFLDYQDFGPGGLRWERFCSSGWADRDGPLGYGFRHDYQRSLRFFRTHAVYQDGRGREFEFGRDETGSYPIPVAGFRLGRDDPRGFVIEHAVEGRMEFRPDPSSRDSARLVRIVKGGVSLQFEYDERGRLVEITEEFRGRAGTRTIDTRFWYDERGHLLRILRAPRGERQVPIVTYTYDDAGCMTGWTDAAGASGSYAYDGARRMTRETDRNGYSFRYRYDSDGRCVETVGQDGLWLVRLQYEPGRTFVTEADGGLWTFYYDEAGTITRVIDPYGGVRERITDEDGRVVREVDSGGRVTRWLYDDLGRNTGCLDRWGNVLPPRDELPNPPNPLAHGMPSTPLGIQWGAPLEELPQAVRFDLPGPIRRLSEEILSTRRLRGTTPESKRDPMGRVLERTDALGRSECFRYDAEGNLIACWDPDGREHRYTNISWNLCGAEIDPLGHSTRFEYTSREKVARIVDANGNESSYAYDFRDRIASVTRHGVLRETYTYDEGDRLIEKKDGQGNPLLSFEVGENGLHSRRVLSSGEVHTYEYDIRGNFTKASAGKVEVDLGHDRYGRPTVDLRDGRGISHRYANGRLAGTSYFDRFVVNYEVDPEAVLTVGTPAGGTQRIRRSVEGAIWKELANGSHVLDHYSPDGRCLGRIIWRGDRPDAPWSVRYRYSPTGELHEVEESDRGVTRFEYDAAHRLICERRPGAPERRMEYDPAGNLLSIPSRPRMTCVEGNRLGESAQESYQYDERNRLAHHVDENGRRTSYHYNSLDMLVRVSWSDRAEEWTADYDGLGRRLFSALGDRRTDYYWDGDRLAAELRPDGGLRLYIYPNEGALVPFLFIEYDGIDADPAAGRPYYVFHNQVGQPLRIEDGAGRTVWQAQQVDPYGTIAVAAGSSITYNLRVPGHYYDIETGLHYNRFRYYDPELGRYLQSDPAGQSGGVNLYAYPANPLVDVDLLGLAHPKKADAGTAESPAKKGPDAESPAAARKGKNPLESMSDEELKQHCKKRAEELNSELDEFTQKKVTIGVTVAQKKGDSSTRRVVITSSTDKGDLPKDRNGNSIKLKSDEDVANKGPELRRRVARDENGKPIREPVLDEDGNPTGETKPVYQTHEVDPETGEAKPYTKKSQAEPEGETRHHAEQRGKNSLDSDEEVAAMAPSRKCCSGCRAALGDDLSKVPTDLQGED